MNGETRFWLCVVIGMAFTLAVWGLTELWARWRPARPSGTLRDKALDALQRGADKKRRRFRKRVQHRLWQIVVRRDAKVTWRDDGESCRADFGDVALEVRELPNAADAGYLAVSVACPWCETSYCERGYAAGEQYVESLADIGAALRRFERAHRKED